MLESPGPEHNGSSEHVAPQRQDSAQSPKHQKRVFSEREPLLSGNEELLDPDDPRVSPLNLKRIKLLRSILWTVLLFNTGLFLLVLVSDFISIPGINSRGKSFLELDLVIFCILTGAITLWCFSVPAYYERILGYISFALVALDVVVAVSVPDLRDGFGLFGNMLMLWVLANLLLNCFADFWVEQGKAQQEIRYTGRIEKRKSLFEICVTGIKIFLKFLLLLVIWNISLTLWLLAFDSHEKPWGKMIPVNEDQFKVHLACFGNVSSGSNGTADSKPSEPSKPKQPIVLVEGGQHTSSEQFQEWIQELYHMNKIERYCIWDRPGYGFSDSASSPTSVGIIVEYLMEALKKEGIEGPYSAVGFDVGGLYSKVFALRNAGQMHSMLLVDSWHEDLLTHWPFSGPNKKNEKRKTFRDILELMDSWQGFKVWVRGVVSPLGVVRSIHWFFHPKSYLSKSRIFGRDMVHSSKYLRARLQEQVTASVLSYNEVHTADVGSIPLSVILSEFMIKKSLNWGKWQRELTKISSKCLEWVVAETSGHYIWESPKGRNNVQQVLLRLVSEKTNY
ncbi:hypothetical protein METBIDRAFT_39790 [Metschnikowia bicuspidata var. bicuspidata NRRL YB-4993]|uniref:AB hydrolase-1 domain-containing protein n=1 Tax=Metschnikowia bicuspidata var. bicuspidata NRRL YB-4993 TaxID=869754 RepID=A0A1A0HEE4_9ASCO|nr:hypothetical protein METBIDRAFT_39790 [Metschnikowia bicuspidata var. bicuspidata NRRL YB-4993]OBA22272.1 hypothetical protein METBIDRAFT_39790 [Metschnikowia bicuspidata var. bicuspidata NRRL YB-4993]